MTTPGDGALANQGGAEDGLQDLRIGDLVIAVEDGDDGALVLRWQGRSHGREIATSLTPYLEEAVTAALASSRRLEMHFEALLHFNSSTLGCLIRFLKRVSTEGPPVVLHYDAKTRWQRLNFDALRSFASPSTSILAVG